MEKLAILALLLSIVGIHCLESAVNVTETKSVFRRQLAEAAAGKDMKKMMRSAKTIEFIEKIPIPAHFTPTTQSPPHNVAGPAIFAAAMGQHMDR